jgi:hypothetical protein
MGFATKKRAMGVSHLLVGYSALFIALPILRSLTLRRLFPHHQPAGNEKGGQCTRGGPPWKNPRKFANNR